MQEIYKDIKGYEGIYKVSNKGNVKSYNTYNNRKPRILTPDKSNAGYLRVKLHNKGVVKRYLVHKLVAEAFIPNENDKPQVNHIDNNPQNNAVENLEWCNDSENMAHSRSQGRQDNVIALASKAMRKANLKRSELKYNNLLNTSLNGRTLLSWFRKGKHIKGVFRCDNCKTEFTAYMDASLKNVRLNKQAYCRSCTKRLKR